MGRSRQPKELLNFSSFSGACCAAWGLLRRGRGSRARAVLGILESWNGFGGKGPKAHLIPAPLPWAGPFPTRPCCSKPGHCQRFQRSAEEQKPLNIFNDGSSCRLHAEQGAFNVSLPLIRQRTQGGKSASPPPYLSSALLHSPPAPTGLNLAAKPQEFPARGSRGCLRWSSSSTSGNV